MDSEPGIYLFIFHTGSFIFRLTHGLFKKIRKHPVRANLVVIYKNVQIQKYRIKL